MAKDVFYRYKPHVNGGAMLGLAQLGFSPLGVRQIEHGQPLTHPQDRGLVAQILSEPASHSEVKYYTITLNQGRVDSMQGWGRWEVNLVAMCRLDPAAMIRLKQLGLSAVGIHQIAHSHVISDPHDRGLVAEILKEEVKYYTITLTQARVVDA